MDPDTDFPISLHDVSLDSVWEEVRNTKERQLATSPSKVKSLEGAAASLGSQTVVQAGAGEGGLGKDEMAGGKAQRRKAAKRRSRYVLTAPSGVLRVRPTLPSRRACVRRATA